MTYPETDYRLGQRASNARNNYETFQRQQGAYARQQAMDDQAEEYQRAQAAYARNAFDGYGFGSGSSYQRTNTPPRPALPGPAHWSVTLGVSTQASVGEIKAAYRRLAVKAHPDHGGSTDAMAKLNAARDQGIRERKAA